MKPSTDLLRVSGVASVVPADEPSWAERISPAEKRRAPRIWQMASVAAHRLCDPRPEIRLRSLVVATGLGALDETRCFLDGVFREGHGSPRNFIASVHNSMGGKLAQDLMIDGPSLTLCDAQNSFAAALGSVDLLHDNELPALVMVVDESVELLDQLLPHLSDGCRQFLRPGWREAAVAFLCSRDGAAGPTLRAAGPMPVADVPADDTCGALSAEAFGADRNVLALAECSTSFPMPAMAAARLLRSGNRGRFVVPSYAPWAQALALVEVCV